MRTVFLESGGEMLLPNALAAFQAVTSDGGVAARTSLGVAKASTGMDGSDDSSTGRGVPIPNSVRAAIVRAAKTAHGSSSQGAQVPKKVSSPVPACQGIPREIVL